MLIDKISGRLTNQWTGPETSKDDWEIYDYGVQILLTYAVIILLVGVLSLVFRQFFLTMCYLLGFLMQRYLSGGYHAKDDVYCIGLTLLVCLVFNLLCLYLPARWINGVDLALFAVSATIIWLLAPVDYAERFDNADYIKHKNQGRRLIIIYGLIVILGLLPMFKGIANALLCGYFTAAISVVMGYSHMHEWR